MPGIQELLIIAVVIFLLFGASRIPELMGSLGKGITAFKQGITDKETDA